MTHRRPQPLPGTEAMLQRACAQYLDHLGLLWFHPPNGGHRNKVVAAKMQGEGVKPGVADIIVLEPRGNCHGLCIELKVTGNQASPRQVDFLRRAWERNYHVAVCYDMDSFIEVVKKYLAQ